MMCPNTHTTIFFFFDLLRSSSTYVYEFPLDVEEVCYVHIEGEGEVVGHLRFDQLTRRLLMPALALAPL